MANQEPISRLRWLDAFRGVAVVGMIATHVAGALLANGWKQGELWNNLNISFGFVAPAFLLCSGIALWVALQRATLQQFPNEGVASQTNRLLLRAGMIVLLGYWLQIPVLSLRQLIWRHDPTELARLFDSNILQVIGVTMIGLIACVRFTQSIAATASVAAVIAAAVIIATPFLSASTSYRILWLPLQAYVAPQPAASFSLFPHSAYLLIGFALSPLFAGRGLFALPFIIPLLLAIFSASTALLLGVWIGEFPPHDNFWHGSIQHTFFRLAGLFVAIALLRFLAWWLRQRCAWLGSHGSRTLIEKIGARSLAIYVLHLMLIYGSPVNMGMTGWMNGQFQNAWGPLLCLLFFAAVTALSYGAATLWNWVRKQYPRVALWGKRAWWIAFWGLFLTIP